MTTRTIDDRDPLITYSSAVAGIENSGWRQLGGPFEYMSTTMQSVVKGSTAVLEFEGVGITVRGTIPAGRDSNNIAIVTSYRIDGGPPVFYRPDVSIEAFYSHVFFRSPQLSNGKHTLTVTNEKTGGFFYLDYFEVIQLPLSDPTPPSNPDPPPPPPTSTTSLVTPSIISSDVLPTPSSSKSIYSFFVSSSAIPDLSSSSLPPSLDGSDALAASTSASEKGRSNIGAIAGGVVAGIAILLVAPFLLLRMRRIRRRRLLLEDQTTTPELTFRPATEARVVSPYTLGPTSPQPTATVSLHSPGIPGRSEKASFVSQEHYIPPPPPYFGSERSEGSMYTS